eukprot:1143642-Pelagomonas_calceolata.AAC.6
MAQIITSPVLQYAVMLRMRLFSIGQHRKPAMLTPHSYSISHGSSSLTKEVNFLSHSSGSPFLSIGQARMQMQA